MNSTYHLSFTSWSQSWYLINTLTVSDVYSRPSCSMLHVRGTS